MARAERRKRRRDREDEQWNEQALAAQAGQEGEFPDGIEFGEDDLPRRKGQANPWDEATAELRGARGPAGPKADPWLAARMGTVRDVAALFAVHWKTVEIWRRKLGLPCVRIGGAIRYALSDVLRWASARKEGV